MLKDPIMKSTIRRKGGKEEKIKQGINCTLYNPRINFDVESFHSRICEFQNELWQENPLIGFAHCIPNNRFAYTDTNHGQFLLGSPLSFHLQMDSIQSLLTNLDICVSHPNNIFPEELPLKFLTVEKIVIPNLTFTDEEMKFLECLKVSKIEAKTIEKNTVPQSLRNKWFEMRKHRITSSNAHKVFIRQRNFEALVEVFLSPGNKTFPKSVQDAMEHGRICEPIARDIYQEIMNVKLKREVIIRETGLVIQPYLFWLAASPDGMVSDIYDPNVFGIIEIKCPESKRNMTPEEAVADKSFYVGVDENGIPFLKVGHSYGYYTQVQMAMGLCQTSYFVAYTYKGMIIIRIPFDPDYFKRIVNKLSLFYKNHILPKRVSNKSRVPNKNNKINIE